MANQIAEHTRLGTTLFCPLPPPSLSLSFSLFLSLYLFLFLSYFIIDINRSLSPPTVEAAVLTINKSLVSDASSTGDVLETLQSEHLSHFSIVPANAQYYAEGLRERLKQKREKVSCEPKNF